LENIKKYQSLFGVIVAKR